MPSKPRSTQSPPATSNPRLDSDPTAIAQHPGGKIAQHPGGTIPTSPQAQRQVDSGATQPTPEPARDVTVDAVGVDVMAAQPTPDPAPLTTPAPAHPSGEGSNGQGGAAQPQPAQPASPERCESESAADDRASHHLPQDLFCDPEFDDPNARLPKIQALRGTNPETCGYFLTEERIVQASWLGEIQDADWTEYTFEESGLVERGLLFQSLRCLVVPRSPVLALDRKASREAKQPVIVELYEAAVHREQEGIQNAQFFELFLLDANNQPLHLVPLAYLAKGANHATFVSHWQAFANQMATCHALEFRRPARPKDNRFNSLCVFEFRTAREQAGEKQKSWACKVVDHTKPTLDTWRTLFLGYDELRRELIGAWCSSPSLT